MCLGRDQENTPTAKSRFRYGIVINRQDTANMNVFAGPTPSSEPNYFRSLLPNWPPTGGIAMYMCGLIVMLLVLGF